MDRIEWSLLTIRQPFRGLGMLGYRSVILLGVIIMREYFQPDNEDRFGESDGFTIWIARMKMSDEELVRSDKHQSE